MKFGANYETLVNSNKKHDTFMPVLDPLPHIKLFGQTRGPRGTKATLRLGPRMEMSPNPIKFCNQFVKLNFFTIGCLFYQTDCNFSSIFPYKIESFFALITYTKGGQLFSGSQAKLEKKFGLYQGSQTRGPRAACGPPRVSMRPALRSNF